MANLLLTNHRANISNFGENWKFYLFRDTYNYILAIRVSESSIEKIRYSLNGNIINHVTDSLKNGLVTRKSAEGGFWETSNF